MKGIGRKKPTTKENDSNELLIATALQNNELTIEKVLKANNRKVNVVVKN